MLNKHLLGVILGFLDCSGGVNYVCKYWAEIASINRLGVISGSEIRFYEILNKEEQHRQLKQLYSKRDQVRAQSLTNNGLRPFDNSNSKSSLASVSTGDVAEATTGSIITSSTDSKTKRSEKSSPKKGPREKKPSFPVNNSGVGTVTVVSNSDDSDSDSDENVAATISTFERKRSKEYLFSNSRTNKKQKDISAKNGGAVMVSYDNVLKTPPGKKKADIFTTSKVAQNDPTSPSDVTSYQQLNKGFNPNFNKHVTIVEPEQSNWLSIDRKNSEQSIDLKPHPILRNALGSTNGDLKREIASAKLNNRESNNDGDGTESDDEGANPKPKSKLASVTYINRKLPAESQVVSTANLPANRPESRNTKKEASESEKILLQNIKKIRTEQQLLALLEYMQAGFIKIEYLNTEKRKLKKLIKAWNFSFERKNGRVPTANERKGHLRDLYEEYQQVLAINVKLPIV